MTMPSSRVWAIVAILGLTWLAAVGAARRGVDELAQPLETLPTEVGDWKGEDRGSLDEATEAVLKASSYLNRVYSKENHQLDMFMAFYSMQRAGEAMHSPKNCLPGSGWEVWDYASSDIVTADGRPVTINRYYVQNGPSRILVLYWYQTRERVIASEYYAKACLVWDAVVSGRTSGSLVKLTLTDEPGAAEAGLEFAARFIPMVTQALPAD